jgi:hypothetical protein
MGGAKRWLKNRPLMSRLFVPVKKLGRFVFGDTQKVVRSGNWHGKDTCWRMVLDLNKCLFFFDGSGQTQKKPLRYLAVVDQLSQLIGANRDYLVRVLPHITELMVPEIDDVVRWAQTIVVTTADPAHGAALAQARADQVVLDFARLKGSHGEYAAEGFLW